MVDFFVPIIVGDITSLFWVDYQQNPDYQQELLFDNKCSQWDLNIAGSDQEEKDYPPKLLSIFNNIESYLTNNFCKTVPSAITIGQPSEILKDIHPKINEDMKSVLLGVFLTAAHKLFNWDIKDSWQSITSTGTFKIIESNDILKLEEIAYYDDKYRKGFLDDITKFKLGNGKKYLFIYINKDNSLEKYNKPENSYHIKSFSPEQNTLFDILEYVFDLPFLPNNPGSDNQRHFFDIFKEKTNSIRSFAHIEPRVSLIKNLSDKLNENSLFIYGLAENGKSNLAIQIARYQIWNKEKYAPIWIRKNNESLIDIYFSSEKLSENENDLLEENLTQQIKEQLFSMFENKQSASCLDILNKRKYLIIIDNLKLSNELLNIFMENIDVFRKKAEKNGSRFIFISTIRYSSENIKNLESFKMRLSDNESEEKNDVIKYFHKISKKEEFYERKINEIKKANDLEKLENLIYKYNGISVKNIEYAAKELFLSPSSDYKDLFKPDYLKKKAEKDNAKYIDTFINLDPNKNYNDDSQWLLLFLLNYNSDEYVTLNKMINDIEEINNDITAKKAMRETEKLNNIQRIKNIIINQNDNLYKMLDKLVNSGFILIKKVESTTAIRIFDKNIYNILFFNIKFSANGLREKLVLRKEMLKQNIYDLLSDNELNEDKLKYIEFLLGLFNNLHEIKYENGTNILHGIARFCHHIEVFDSIFNKCPQLFYITDKNGKPVPVVDDLGQTALHYSAAGNKNPEVIKWLINKAKEVSIIGYLDMPAKNGNIPIHYAAEFNKNPKIINYFLQNDISIKESINCQNNEGLTPLLYACWRGSNPEITEALLKPFNNELKKDIKSDVNLKTNNNQNALHLCVFKPINQEVVKEKIKLIEKYTKKDVFKTLLEQTDSEGRIPLLYAVAWINDIEILEKLIPSRKALNNGPSGYTSLHAAVRYNTQDVVKFLVQNKKALINKPDYIGFSPLHYVVLSEKNNVDKYEMIKLLKVLGANLNSKDNQKMTPLHCAVETGQEAELVKLLITKKNINFKTNKKFFESTPLHLALNIYNEKKLNNEVISELVKHGASIKITDEYGKTPLYYAKINGNYETNNIINSL